MACLLPNGWNATRNPVWKGTPRRSLSRPGSTLSIGWEIGSDARAREAYKIGHDIESRIPGTGKMGFIEVNGRVAGAETITITKNGILYSLNKPEDYILSMVALLDDGTHQVHYVRRPFEGRYRRLQRSVREFPP